MASRRSKKPLCAIPKKTTINLIAAVTAYAFSPIDLIPDFIPVLGYLDDLVIIPLGVFLVLKLIPPQVMQEQRTRAAAHIAEGRPVYKFMAPVVIAIVNGRSGTRGCRTRASDR